MLVGHHPVKRQQTLAIIELLLDRGAHINARSAEGKTALTIAKEQGRSDAVAALEKRGGVEYGRDR